jgi:hypothetical protein
MGRKVAVVWHALFSIAAGVLYFYFVVPRWPELLGDTPPALGTALRIVCGSIIALAALPVVFTLLRTRRPEYGTPQLALTLRTSSIVLHVLGGVLIIGAAISEIWLSLDSAGQWLFGIYGAAAAIAVLGIATFYLAFVAELPPPPPRPIKSREKKRRRGGRTAADEDAAEQRTDKPTHEDVEKSDEDVEKSDEDVEKSDEEADAVPVESADEQAEVTAEDEAPAADEETPAAADEPEGEPEGGGLRNRRPSGQTSSSRRRRRLRGSVAIED